MVGKSSNTSKVAFTSLNLPLNGSSSMVMITFYACVLVVMFPGLNILYSRVILIIEQITATPLNLAAGFLYGVWTAFATSMTGLMLGSIIAFVLGRTIARSNTLFIQIRIFSYVLLRQLIFCCSILFFKIWFMNRIMNCVRLLICFFFVNEIN